MSVIQDLCFSSSNLWYYKKKLLHNYRKKKHLNYVFWEFFRHSKLTSSRALQRTVSGKSRKGSRLSRSVAENRTGCCGMMEMWLRKCGRPSFAVSMLSILIVPSSFANLKSADIIDDLPAPVRPTIPTCKDHGINSVKFWHPSALNIQACIC